MNLGPLHWELRVLATGPPGKSPTATLFTLAKVWRQPVSINRWMDKEDMVYIYNGMLIIKRNKILPFAATWMDLEGIMLSEIVRERQIPYDITCMWNLKNITN